MGAGLEDTIWIPNAVDVIAVVRRLTTTQTHTRIAPVVGVD